MDNTNTIDKVYHINVAFIGESGIGKTSIINRLQHLNFQVKKKFQILK